MYKQQYRMLPAQSHAGKKSLSACAGRREFFPDIVAHMTSVGERSGSLAGVVPVFSGLYEVEAR